MKDRINLTWMNCRRLLLKNLVDPGADGKHGIQPRLVTGAGLQKLPLSVLLTWADTAQAGVYRWVAEKIADEIGDRPGNGSDQ